MNLAILGSFEEVPFAEGWTRERAIAFLGGGVLDLTKAQPGDQARLTATALLGSVKIVVPPGSRVSMSGVSLLGSRELLVAPAGGPQVAIRGIAILGSVEVKEAIAVAAA
jgi:hypothetical protein